MRKAPESVELAEAGTATTNQFQEEGVPMNTSLPRAVDNFEAETHVAGVTVAPNTMTGGTQPDEAVVTLRDTGVLLTFTPTEACALAAALQAVAVHQLEQAGGETR